MQAEGQPVGEGCEGEDVGSRRISHHGVDVRPGDGSRREIVGIVPGNAPVDHIAADTRIEGIISSHTDQCVVTRAADEAVIAGSAGQNIVSVSAIDGGGQCGVAGDGVVTGTEQDCSQFGFADVELETGGRIGELDARRLKVERHAVCERSHRQCVETCPGAQDILVRSDDGSGCDEKGVGPISGAEIIGSGPTAEDVVRRSPFDGVVSGATIGGQQEGRSRSVDKVVSIMAADGHAGDI